MTRPTIDRPAGLASAAATAGLLFCIVGATTDVRAMLVAWLTTALFLIGLPLGALTVLMVHGLTGGRWGETVRQPLRALVATLPLGLLFLLPVLVRLDLVFPWAGADTAALPDTVRQKLAYLNVPFFLLRFAICSAIWLLLTSLVLGWTADDRSRGNMGKGCTAGLIVHGAAVTIFAIDWMLSLEPEFTSTIYAFLEAASEVVGAFALAMIMLAAKRAIETIPGGEEDVALSEDVANMAFGFMLMWVYLAFMQWLVIWGGDLPDEIHWYVIRASHGWQYLLWLLIALQFALPLAGFLSRNVKRSHAGLLILAGLLLVGHFIDVLWRIRPPLSVSGIQELWCDLAAMAGAGGLWLALLFFLAARPERIAFWRRMLVHG